MPPRRFADPPRRDVTKRALTACHPFHQAGFLSSDELFTRFLILAGGFGLNTSLYRCLIMVTKSLPKVLFLNEPRCEDDAYVKHVHSLATITTIPQVARKEQISLIRSAVEDAGPFVAWVWFYQWDQPGPLPMDEELLQPLAESGCKFITMGGAGYDHIDIKYLTAHKLQYANNPDSVGYRTADHTAMLILMALKGMMQSDAAVRAGRWSDRFNIVSKETRGTVLGIIGMGNIGKQVARHMQNFGLKVIYTKRSRLPTSEEQGATFVSFEELLAQADVISLCCPLTEETRHVLSDREFAKMKNDVIIVNTARGPVIHEDALVRALDSGKVLRAALDVFEFEPSVHPGLKSSPKTILSPHSAVVDGGIIKDQHLEILRNLESFLRTGQPITPVN
ncbi:glycerate-and formate-dehydrogenase [Phaffia rhodozyma]|uniref:Glycerate-and formate-dehydrogenase n=1 Tax=Phaffia rhodozyma TaxID=264483 RepID=A0A0F7SL99_PHARH|nr:glycerate-and formate-dehydrogenase [Phaffia rhodozyma]